MRFGVVGLGRMGSNIVAHAAELGHEVVVFDTDRASVDALRDSAVAAYSLGDLATKLQPPRVVMLLVPHGDPVTEVCRQLEPVLEPGDVVADCGNSHWDESQQRHERFAKRDVYFLDVGTSGGLAGARRGASFTVGGDVEAFRVIEPLLVDLAVDDAAVFHVGGSGSGHFAKNVHNGIEFGIVQAIAEGAAVAAAWDEKLDLATLLDHWNHGSVIRGWLIELAARALRAQGDLQDLARSVEDTGEVKWLLAWGLQHDIPTPVVATAQTALMQYRDLNAVQAKVHALIRHEFGGHPIHRTGGARRSP